MAALNDKKLTTESLRRALRSMVNPVSDAKSLEAIKLAKSVKGAESLESVFGYASNMNKKSFSKVKPANWAETSKSKLSVASVQRKDTERAKSLQHSTFVSVKSLIPERSMTTRANSVTAISQSKKLFQVTKVDGKDVYVFVCNPQSVNCLAPAEPLCWTNSKYDGLNSTPLRYYKNVMTDPHIKRGGYINDPPSVNGPDGRAMLKTKLPYKRTAFLKPLCNTESVHIDVIVTGLNPTELEPESDGEEEMPRTSTPPPGPGMHNMSVQTRPHRVLLTDECFISDAGMQTDPVPDFEIPELDVKFVTDTVEMIDMSTQIDEFDPYEDQLVQITVSTVGIIIDQAFVEMMEEDELEDLKIQRKVYTDLLDLELKYLERCLEAKLLLKEETKRQKAVHAGFKSDFQFNWQAAIAAEMELDWNAIYGGNLQDLIQTHFVEKLAPQIQTSSDYRQLARSLLDDLIFDMASVRELEYIRGNIMMEQGYDPLGMFRAPGTREMSEESSATSSSSEEILKRSAGRLVIHSSMDML